MSKKTQVLLCATACALALFQTLYYGYAGNTAAAIPYLGITIAFFLVLHGLTMRK